MFWNHWGESPTEEKSQRRWLKLICYSIGDKYRMTGRFCVRLAITVSVLMQEGRILELCPQLRISSFRLLWLMASYTSRRCIASNSRHHDGSTPRCPLLNWPSRLYKLRQSCDDPSARVLHPKPSRFLTPR